MVYVRVSVRLLHSFIHLYIHLLLTLTVVCTYRVFLEVLVVEALVEPRELQDLVGQMVHLVMKVQRVNWDR